MGGFIDSTGSAGITANASRGKGNSDGDSTTHANSHLNIGGITKFDIGGDVNIAGGVLNLNHLTGHVDGDVNVKSLQDTATYESNQKQMGISADIDLVKGTSTSFGVSGSKTNMTADYAQVKEQSGFFMNSTDLQVDGKGTFEGGAFLTKSKDDNRAVFKQGITVSDIDNHSRYEGESISGGINLNGSRTNDQGQPDKTVDSKWNTSSQGIGYGTDSDSQTSTTYGAVTGMAGKSEVTTDNKELLNETLDNTFDAQKIGEELNAQTHITQEFGKEAPKAVGDYASKKQIELIEKGQIEEAEKWGEGGIYRVGLHTLTSALATGSIEGAVAGGTTAVSVPALDNYLKEQGYDDTSRNVILSGFSAGLGAMVGGDTASTVSTTMQTENNYLKHTEIQAWSKEILACKTESCKELVNTKYLRLSIEHQRELENACSTNLTKCEQLRQAYFSKEENNLGLVDGEIRSTNDGAKNLFIVTQIHNQEAEALWINVSRNNPSNSTTDNIGWELAADYNHRTSVLGGATSKVRQSNSSNRVNGVDHTSSQKKKANSLEVGDKIRTPTNHPDDFNKSGQNYVNKKTGEIWQKSNTNHSGDSVGEWKVGLNKKGRMQTPTESKKITIGMSDGKVIKIENK